jgi:TIR domain
MKVFISHSGPRSRAIALALKDWMPLVLHYVDPWVSQKDIAAGDRWAVEVGAKLSDSNFGIICLTPENLNAPWLLFEAGAISKSFDEGAVCADSGDCERYIRLIGSPQSLVKVQAILRQQIEII